MKRLLMTAACLALLSSPAAFAGPPPVPAGGFTGYAVGTIASVDAAAGTLTLADGKTYTVPTNLGLNQLMVGQVVTIAFTNQDGKLVASDVRRTES
jgi:hypothetical protein